MKIKLLIVTLLILVVAYLGFGREYFFLIKSQHFVSEQVELFRGNVLSAYQRSRDSYVKLAGSVRENSHFKSKVTPDSKEEAFSHFLASMVLGELPKNFDNDLGGSNFRRSFFCAAASELEPIFKFKNHFLGLEKEQLERWQVYFETEGCETQAPETLDVEELFWDADINTPLPKLYKRSAPKYRRLISEYIYWSIADVIIEGAH